MATEYKVNVKLWACCSVALLCLFIALDPGIGLKENPLREDLVWGLLHREGQMPITIVLEFILGAMFLFGIPSAAFGWVLHAIGIVAWSRLTKKNMSRTAPPPLPKGFGKF